MIAVANRAASWIADRCNPIVVKEARQAVRSRTIISLITLEILALLAITGGTALFQGRQARDLDGNGLEVFMTINGGVMFLCALFVPAFVAGKLASERKGVAADLLYTTSIGPASVVWGKVAVTMMIASLLLSVAAPFLVVSYLLRGIDLPTIATVLATDVIVILLCAQAAITVAAFPVAGVLRVLAAIAAVPLFVYVAGLSFAGIAFLGGGGSGGLRTADAWWAYGAFAGVALGSVGLFFTLTVSMLQAPHADRATLPRVYTSALWVATLIGAQVYAIRVSDPAVIAIWGVAWLILASIAIALCAGERRTLGARVRVGVPRRLVYRIPRALFMSGAATGLTWSILLAAATVAVWYAQEPVVGLTTVDRSIASIVPNLASLPLYALVVALVSVAIRDRFFARWLEPGMTTGGAVLLFGLLSTVPFIVTAVLDPRNWDHRPVAAVLIPVGAPLFSDSLPELPRQALIFSGGAAAVLVVLHARWFFRQFRQYRPLDEHELQTPRADTPPPPAEPEGTSA